MMIKIEMVEIPASQDQKISSFRIGKYPITQEQYEALIGTNPSHFQGKPQNPVESVSYNDAIVFCQKLSEMTGKNYRLPTNSEWEYACRAGTVTGYYFGNDCHQLEDYAWYFDNSQGTTHPGGLKLPNTWGLYDMHGNVWEWCQDDYHPNYQGALTDGSAWISDPKSKLNEAYIPKSLRGRFWEELSEEEKRAINFYTPKVLRGGSWDSFPNYTRSASRDRNNQRDLRYNVNGFRVVCDNNR